RPHGDGIGVFCRLTPLDVLGAVTQHLFGTHGQAVAFAAYPAVRPDPPAARRIEGEHSAWALRLEGVPQRVTWHREGGKADRGVVDRVGESGVAGQDRGPDRAVVIQRTDDHHAPA